MIDGRTILVFGQVYPPDPASVGQHLSDMAVEMVRRGYRVDLIAAQRGYDDPARRYPAYELRDGVHVRRVPFTSFGKSGFVPRAAAATMFIAWCIWFGLTTRKLATIVVSTTPPFVGFAAGLVRILRGTPFVYWVMDLNPDQLIALGAIEGESAIARGLDRIERFVLRRADAVIVLDRFMAERVNRRLDVRARMYVVPPWPLEDALEPVAPEENWFRARHELGDRFVVMYSGNHGHSTPVEALLRAAELLAGDPQIVFVFVGGGVRKPEVDAHVARLRPANVVSLPYQPLEDLKFSLSAADLHIVTMAANVVGIVHPCKIYGAMAVGRPILLVGPETSHASDLLDGGDIGWRVPPDSPDAIADAVRTAAALSRSDLRRIGERAQAAIARDYSKARLCGRFADIVEQTVAAGRQRSRRR